MVGEILKGRMRVEEQKRIALNQRTTLTTNISVRISFPKIKISPIKEGKKKRSNNLGKNFNLSEER